MSAAILLAVDADSAALGDVERELSDRYARSYRVVCTARRTRRSRPSPGWRMPGKRSRWSWRRQWLSETTGGELLERVRPAPPARQARAADRLGGVGASADGRGDLRRDGAGADRLLRAQAGGLAGRAVSPVHLQLPARVDRGAAHRSAHGPRRRRGLGGQGARAEGCSAALRDPARLLPERLGGGARRACQGGPGGEAPPHGPSRRSGPERPDEHGDRRRRPAPRSTPSGTTSTWSSSAPGRPASRQRSTAPPRACDTLVVDEGGIGGQATSSSLIRNYLGFPRGVSGRRLAEQAYEQAWVFGAKFAFMHRATAPQSRRRPAAASPSPTTGGSAPER